MNPVLTFLLFLTVRVASVFIVKTFYVPDEYWQSLEVAHKLVFGYGYLTWEWLEGIRSYIYPVIIAGLYKILALIHLDLVEYLVISPRFLQALLSSYADYRFYIWTGKKKWSIFLLLITFFWFYCGSRTLANTFETALSTIALSYFPWDKRDKTSYLWFVGTCCYIRPTAAIVWLPLCLNHLLSTKLSKTELILKRFVPIGLIIFSIGIAIDSYFYGKLILTPWEFIKFNYLLGIGSFYGTHPWHWYFLTGLPSILGVNYLPFLIGVIQTIRNKEMYIIRKQLLITIFITLITYSIFQHKEFRFILILLPLCLYISVDTLVRWSYKASKWAVWVVAIILLIGNAIPNYYLSLVHQRGTLEVMPFLAEISKVYTDEVNSRANILFLMPCHSTPYYSHIHQNVTLRFLTCNPNIHMKQNYIDEAELFYRAPDRWLRSHIPSYPKTAMPTHVVLFDSLESKISDFLTNYYLIDRIHHTDYADERVGNYVLVFERKNLNTPGDNIFNKEAEETDDQEAF
ncbi:GPI mannosyltransferase 3 [Condylostylus longicornis]|uniref:GPI mannosyltransferase 3 n=1 Tax=Condylostylus longicornis TaxID=2530218 RepID=UPI00244E1022|nr:GPI mannosyltransferase 3 [Condylostylus longicornis]